MDTQNENQCQNIRVKLQEICDSLKENENEIKSNLIEGVLNFQNQLNSEGFLRDRSIKKIDQRLTNFFF